MPRTAQAVDTRSTPSAADRIIQPGRNCWRVERADRFYCIQDAADHFRLVRQAILSARHSVFILGWDVFAAVDLVPGAAPSDAPTRLDELLAFVARRRPRLRCYILIWDYAALYTLERDLADPRGGECLAACDSGSTIGSRSAGHTIRRSLSSTTSSRSAAASI